MLKDILSDVVQHTYDLGCIDLVKITGTDAETELDALADDKSVIVQAKFKAPVADFISTFGMPNLGKLKILLALEPYADKAKIAVTKKTVNGAEVLDGIHFENATGDFKNDYRFMSTSLVNNKLQKVTFKGATFDVEFSPAVESIRRLKMQAQANAEEVLFTAKTEDNDLKLFFGDPSTHAGDFVFQAGVGNKLSRAWSWPAARVISILDLVGDKKVHIANAGAMKITVDSGLCEYTYFLPAQTK